MLDFISQIELLKLTSELKDSKILSINKTSVKFGTFVILDSPSRSKVAAKIGSEEFFCTTNFYISL